MTALLLDIVYGNRNGPCIASLCLDLFDRAETHLLACYSHKVDILNTDGSSIGGFASSNKMIAFNKIKPFGLKTDWLLVLTDINTFYVVSFHHLKGDIDYQIVKTFDLNNQIIPKASTIDFRNEAKSIITQNCFISVDPQSTRFILVHSFKGFVMVLELKPSKKHLFLLALQGKVHPDVKRNPELERLDEYQVIEQPVSFYIGENIIFDLHLVQSEEASTWWLAILSRNPSFEYTLKYYLLCKSKKIQLRLHQTISLKEVPDLVVPFSSFFIFFYPTKQMLYSMPNIELFDETSKNNIFSKRDHMVYELDLKTGLYKKLISYAVISDDNLLLISSDSEYFQLTVNFEFVSGFKGDEMKRRTRKQFEEDVISTLHFKQWNVTDLTYKSDTLHNFNLKYINGVFLAINKQSELIKVLIKGREVVEKVTKLKTELSLPITNLDCERQLTFTSTDSHLSYFQSQNFAYLEKETSMKNYLKVGDFTIIVSELSPKNIEEHISIVAKLKVYGRDGELLAHYEFDELVYVTCMISLIDFTPFLSEQNDFLNSEVEKNEKLLSNSFVVLTTSANESDYDTDEDLYMRRRTESFLFVINESNELELKAISVLKCRVQSIVQFDKRTIFMVGDYVNIKFGITLFRDNEGDNQVKFKFIKHGEQKLQIANSTVVKRLSENIFLLVDPYLGVYATTIGTDNLLKSEQKLIFPWKLITSMDVFSEDTFIIGDMLGNITMLDVVYDASPIPQIKISNQFNPNLGAVGCISCYPSGIRNDKYIKICTFGTSNGIIASISILKSTSKDYSKVLMRSKKEILANLDNNIEHRYHKLSNEFKEISRFPVQEWLVQASSIQKLFCLKTTHIMGINAAQCEYNRKEPLIIIIKA